MLTPLLVDFAWHTIHVEKDAAKEVSNYIVAKVREYGDGKGYKFMGAGTSAETFKICPYLTVRLWSELDIVTIIFQSVSLAVGSRSLSRHLQSRRQLLMNL